MKSYAIVGAGYTGLSVLAQLLEHAKGDVASITLFDVPEKLAVGTAFAEDVSTNLLNRPVNSMYFRERGDFGAWLARHDPKAPVTDSAFLPRARFGQFLCHQLRECQQQAASLGIEFNIVPQRVIDVFSLETCLRVQTEDGTDRFYHRCFLCLGTATSHDPYGLRHQPGYYDSVWPVSCLDITRDDCVAIIGSRLSAHDAAIALASKCRKIYFLSRKGALPRQIEGYCDITPQAFTTDEIDRLLVAHGRITVAQLFRLLRREFNAHHCSLSQFIQHADPGVTAMSILLALNNTVSYAWRKLSEHQRQHFILRWQPRWQQLRIPIASPNAEKIAALFRSGKLEHLHGDIAITPRRQGFTIAVPGREPIVASKVINASGISSAPASYPLAQRLVQRGMACEHPFGGIRVCSDSLCLQDVAGRTVSGIKCIGQLTVGDYYAVGNIDVLHSQARQAVISGWHDTPLAECAQGEER
ncbi:putative NAD(P)/FAD-binding protein YdhS [Yokenella regensburgei]|uniref:NAD(P)/FAD-binding protein YdhS n=1 Tax=Yokenella regensburgei TaxID=158877 RepID=A0ABX9S3F5_9ENTR|nr:FAD/NAD(P)-binding protein [Yokenella regensburgei]RKR65184.1 putative NAD(P)/FAD-binding protein YdhS [Yokenella regensburgei]VFS16841.1 Uncharacterized protein conserved in bacteria [Yokenella regensburgei]